MNKLFIAFAAFVATFFVHGFQFFKKQTPLVNALVVGLVVYFVAGFLGFKEGNGDTTCTCNYKPPAYCTALVKPKTSILVSQLACGSDKWKGSSECLEFCRKNMPAGADGSSNAANVKAIKC